MTSNSLMYFVATPLLSLCVTGEGEREREGGRVVNSFLPLKSGQTRYNVQEFAQLTFQHSNIHFHLSGP